MPGATKSKARKRVVGSGRSAVGGQNVAMMRSYSACVPIQYQ